MSKYQETLILPQQQQQQQQLQMQPQASPPHHHHHHRQTYIVKSLTIILALTIAVLVINYYLISNCPKDTSDPPVVVGDSNNVVLHTGGGHQQRINRVTVSVYYEVLCPDSKHFILKQLVPTWAKYSPYLDLRLVPFGKASVVKQQEGGYKFKCQHGPEECHGNMLHACVIQEFNSNQTLQLQIVACSMERFRPWGTTKDQITDVVKDCRAKYYGGGHEAVMCGNADELLAQHGHETLDLTPAITFIPTIAVDGSLSNQRQILRDLKTVICEIVVKRGSSNIDC